MAVIFLLAKKKSKKFHNIIISSEKIEAGLSNVRGSHDIQNELLVGL